MYSLYFGYWKGSIFKDDLDYRLAGWYLLEMGVLGIIATRIPAIFQFILSPESAITYGVFWLGIVIIGEINNTVSRIILNKIIENLENRSKENLNEEIQKKLWQERLFYFLSWRTPFGATYISYLFFSYFLSKNWRFYLTAKKVYLVADGMLLLSLMITLAHTYVLLKKIIDGKERHPFLPVSPFLIAFFLLIVNFPKFLTVKISTYCGISILILLISVIPFCITLKNYSWWKKS
ncbi:MAG: hypothetical protein GWO20_01515 [Candidatus Korarchaeota archaeon]|nr:hypothetical protein [Candidatus Korarchaeota archaeon]NIU82195.1 hypothetical protein [Candidatus Thorarchaeota archaeon]NIW12668.1 hypothetical protein [Candidatus Thorarchaeota archaeon]NIW50872.1 hypothetical protein [Candidatus Korarchaeota archaeon]